MPSGDVASARRARSTEGLRASERARAEAAPPLDYEMKILAFILDPAVIRKILHHLGKKRSLPARAPPNEKATAIS